MAKANIEIEISKVLVENIRNLIDALQKIVALHGTKEHPRHECTHMANIARDALREIKNDLR